MGRNGEAVDLSERTRHKERGIPRAFLEGHEDAMNRDTLIRQIQRAQKEQTGEDYPIDFPELSDRTLERLAVLLRELEGRSKTAVRSACDAFLQEAERQECLCFGPPVADCPIYGWRTTT